MHFYSSGRAPATKFTPDVYEAQMQTFVAMERAVVQQRALMDGFDPERRCGLLIDEWGVWDRMVPDEEKRYGRLWQQITIRSAVAAALGLNVFQRQAEKLVMGNIAQTVNVLHSVLLTHEDHCIRTPAYYAFELEKPHRGNTAVHVDGPAPGGLELSVSASRRDGALVLTLVNPKLNEGVGLTCGLNRGSVRSAKARTLQHSDMNACNTFERPDTVVPREQAVKAAGSRIEIELPPLSVTTVEAQLA
jgi:alpha-N-arabinofuranosidase